MSSEEQDEQEEGAIKTFIRLVWLHGKVRWHNFKEFFSTLFRYYHNFSFMKADIALRLLYLFQNPFTISKVFLMKKGEKDLYAYGETPLRSLETIAKICDITAADCVFELGAGRGRGCFWLHSFIGCRVVGIEYVPTFVKRARQVVDLFGLKALEFREEDFFDADLRGASVCYLYGTSLDDERIGQLADKFSCLPPGTKIITASYPLSDYCRGDCFELTHHFTVPFTWGEGDIFVQVVTHHHKEKG